MPRPSPAASPTTAEPARTLTFDYDAAVSHARDCRAHSAARDAEARDAQQVRAIDRHEIQREACAHVRAMYPHTGSAWIVGLLCAALAAHCVLTGWGLGAVAVGIGAFFTLAWAMGGTAARMDYQLDLTMLLTSLHERGEWLLLSPALALLPGLARVRLTASSADDQQGEAETTEVEVADVMDQARLSGGSLSVMSSLVRMANRLGPERAAEVAVAWHGAQDEVSVVRLAYLAQRSFGLDEAAGYLRRHCRLAPGHLLVVEDWSTPRICG